MRALRQMWQRFRKEDDGASTITFVLFLPLFVLLILSSLEMGRLLFRQVMTERALDLTVRELRLGIWVPTNATELKRRICNYSAGIPNCMNEMYVDIQPVSKTTWVPMGNTPTCVDHFLAVQPNSIFQLGTSNDFMLIRACTKFYPLVPTAGLGFALGKDASGAYTIVAASMFVNEPRPGN